MRAVSLLIGSLVAVLAALQDPPAGPARTSEDITVDGSQVWTTTKIELKPGERLIFAASGSLRCPGQQDDNGPNGLNRGYRDLLRNLPFNNAGRGALIGRIGEADVAQPFLIGAARDLVTASAGPLSVGVNHTESDLCTGTYSVRVHVYPPAAGVQLVVAKEVRTLSAVDQELFKKIPRRIGDFQGNPGDMVNFVLLGSEAAMQEAFTAAGWVKVDADVRGAVLSGVLGSLSKESYVTMPMSPLYLFGRPQDYGWAHAEPIKVVSTRHHLRVWKAPFQAGGAMLWVGAATHDIGFERDQRNNGITHKIDPDVDLERDYLRKTFVATGLVTEYMHLLPDDALREAKTATGGSFHSDGQVLVLKLVEKP
jgi:hypothetical protein